MSNEFELPPQVETKGVKTAPVTTKAEQEPKDEAKKNDSDYDEAELAKIFDEIIFTGVYSETVTIKGKLRVTLKTRTAEESDEISMKLDTTPANLISTLNEKRALINVYYAMTSYQGKDLSGLKMEQREKFVNQIPAPVINAIVKAIAKFDSKVYKACSEGEENF